MYQENCIVEGTEPVKKHVYNSIFNRESNLGFFVPKSDQCDVCEEFNLISKPFNEDDALRYEDHMQGKISTKTKETKTEWKL